VAASGGQKDAAELLLAHGAEVNAQTCGMDASGITPLHMALGTGHKDVIELLRQHGGHE
jgi:ankyrin repeat protein